jgi:hypothetical protein
VNNKKITIIKDVAIFLCTRDHIHDLQEGRFQKNCSKFKNERGDDTSY